MPIGSASFRQTGFGHTGEIPFTLGSDGAKVWVKRAGAWVSATVWVKRGGAWVPGVVNVKRGGSWSN